VQTTSTKTNGARLWQEKTRLLDYHDSAANVTNSAIYSNRVTASGPVPTSKQKHPVILCTNP